MSTEVAVPTETQTEVYFDDALAKEEGVERELFRAIVKGIAISIPIMIIFFIALLAVAVGDRTEWYVWVFLGTLMGMVGGVLFGMLAAVTIKATQLDEVDREALH